MADAQESQRSLWLRIFWKPEFRSRLEMVAYSLSGAISVMLIMTPMLFDWFDSLTAVFSWVLLVVVLDLTGRVVWECRREMCFSADDP